jgi:hypothetical protein
MRNFYESKVSPEYKKVNTKVVVIASPAVGDVTFFRWKIRPVN